MLLTYIKTLYFGLFKTNSSSVFSIHGRLELITKNILTEKKNFFKGSHALFDPFRPTGAAGYQNKS